MKQSKNRGRGANSRRRSNTPDVICLPQAKPPTTPPRKEPEALRAFALPRLKEPTTLVSSALAKKRCGGQARALVSRNESIEHVATTPLPRDRALVVAPQAGLAQIRQWLRKLVMKPKKAALTIDRASARTQVRALRVEVAQLQRSLDQLMAQLKAAERC